MRVSPRLRSRFVIITLLSTAIFLFAASAWTQQSTQERPVWDVQMALNAQAGSTITIQNQCRQTHSFTVNQQQTPFLQLLAPATAEVAGNSSYQIPVRFNTNGMKAGQYQGTVVIKCETCRKEKTCKQDREVLPVHLIVRGEGGPQLIPENPTQPQNPEPPIVKQDKPETEPHGYSNTNDGKRRDSTRIRRSRKTKARTTSVNLMRTIERTIQLKSAPNVQCLRWSRTTRKSSSSAMASVSVETSVRFPGVTLAISSWLKRRKGTQRTRRCRSGAR